MLHAENVTPVRLDSRPLLADGGGGVCVCVESCTYTSQPPNFNKKIQPFDTLCINCVHVPLSSRLDIKIHKRYTVYMITIHITEKQYTKHYKLIIKLQKALANMDTTTPQAAYNRRERAKSATSPQSLLKQTADAVKPTTKPTRYARFVEFTNQNGKLCSQRLDGSMGYIESVFMKNEKLKPKWVSEFMPSEEALMWAAGQALADADDSNSWRV